MLTEKRQEEREFDFTPNDFSRVRKLIYQHAGISLSEAKSDMVYSRIGRRLRTVGFDSFKTYLDNLESENSPVEWEAFTNALTTNLTSFFREEHHFPILAEHLVNLKKPIRIWCSAASTGEEPYTIAMTACEAFGTMKPPVEIIATDIDTNVLATAARGVYPYERVSKLSDERRRRFFQKGTGAHEGSVRVRNELRSLITFDQLNLLDEQWSLNDQFDVIFCRNVMIYFDKPTQSKILSHFVPLMKAHALLFAGHSENFLYVSNDFHLRGKTVYELSDGKNTKRTSNQVKERIV
ncbi:CheR family methyltransferase [Methylotenera sp.]|uniref:CheR family methyltransferase n=1 Tax=Methylotenera sp. TaxID=2051956 RepID=UPI00271EE743|nr:CheR family methyltransferase [Methylotenera sp.]MDO9204522.1 CheR family methyltransferase [Methylotenera sp.]MDO9393781.1 CheR family methyltransferase [Methylotenera sp.]MDP1523222.1 CheR family methyltransferase [Methylotenera sp.]MDP2071441.1 CheR family methyltransferase [Methylotenera sp.]MDP3005402.1 CheR family methyltransferase [Methylotenera sp.]